MILEFLPSIEWDVQYDFNGQFEDRMKFPYRAATELFFSVCVPAEFSLEWAQLWEDMGPGYEAPLFPDLSSSLFTFETR